jgi:protein TonB
MKKFFLYQSLTAFLFLFLFLLFCISCADTGAENNSGNNESGGGNGSDKYQSNESKRDRVKEIVYESFNIQEQPYFPGGEEGLTGFIQKNIQYPKEARESRIEGTVFVRFVVTKTGDIGETQITRTVDPNLEYEALRIVKSLPKWKPGKKEGKPVNVWLIVPVEFNLH